MAFRCRESRGLGILSACEAYNPGHVRFKAEVSPQIRRAASTEPVRVDDVMAIALVGQHRAGQSSSKQDGSFSIESGAEHGRLNHGRTPRLCHLVPHSLVSLPQLSVHAPSCLKDVHGFQASAV